MKRFLFGFLLIACATTVSATVTKVVLNGLTYTWPASHVAGVLYNDGTGTLSWEVTTPSNPMPTGAIIFMNAACPSGYTEYTGLQGRYVLGLPSGGSLAYNMGTALSNQENRVVGLHTHVGHASINFGDPGHSHGLSITAHSHTGDATTSNIIGNDGEETSGNTVGADTGTTMSSGTGISIQNATISATLTVDATVNNYGSVTGTNAPYIQLRACSKN